MYGYKMSTRRKEDYNLEQQQGEEDEEYDNDKDEYPRKKHFLKEVCCCPCYCLYFSCITLVYCTFYGDMGQSQKLRKSAEHVV